MKTLVLCGNPCIQNLYYETLATSESVEVKRCDRFEQGLGGKGVNVSLFLNHHHSPHELFCVLGSGLNSQQIIDTINKQRHTKVHSCEIKEDNRICTTTIQGDEIQEWIAPSPEITDQEKDNIIESLKVLIKEQAYQRVVLSGTWPGDIKGLISVLINFKNSGGELVVDSFQGFEIWFENQQFPSVWKLNHDEWKMIYQKIGTVNIPDCLQVSTSKFSNQMTHSDLNLSLESKVPLVEIPKNTIGAGDIWLGALIANLNQKPFSDYSIVDLDEAMSWANNVAAQRVQRHSYWAF